MAPRAISHFFSSLFSLHFLQFRARQRGQFDRAEKHVRFRPCHLRDVHALHGHVPLGDGVEHLCGLFWGGIRRGHNHTLYLDHKIPRAARLVLPGHEGRPGCSRWSWRRHGCPRFHVLFIPDYFVTVYGQIGGGDWLASLLHSNCFIVRVFVGVDGIQSGIYSLGLQQSTQNVTLYR